MTWVKKTTKAKASVSATKKQNSKSVNKSESKPKSGKKLFSKDYQPNNKCGGRPIQELSYKAMSKVRHAKNPERVQADLDRLDQIIDDKKSTPADVMRAIDMKIRLNSGYDPAETKDVTEQKHERVYKGLSLEQINKLLGEK